MLTSRRNMRKAERLTFPMGLTTTSFLRERSLALMINGSVSLGSLLEKVKLTRRKLRGLWNPSTAKKLPCR